MATSSARALVAACATLFLTFLDTTVVSVALPDLQLSSSVGVSDLQWIVDGYLLIFTSLTLAGGALADRLGVRPLLLGGLAVFAGGSVLTAISAPNGGWDGVRVGRLVQGLGAALSEPATLAVVRRGYADARERARALGVWAAVAGLAIATGPVVGGLLVAAGGWRAVFWANVPLAVIAAAAVVVGVPKSPAGVGTLAGQLRPRGRLDLAGLTLVAVTLSGVTWGLIEAQQRGFDDTAVQASLALAAGGLVALVVQERRAADPALPLPLVAGRATIGANAAALAASFAVFAIFFFVAIDLQTVGTGSAGGTALAFTPLAVLLTAGGLVAGRWTAARGPTQPMVTGLGVGAAGLLLTDASLGTDPGLGPVALALGVVGAGLGLVLAPAASTVLASTGPERAGTAAAVVNLARQVGGLLAVGILGVIAVRRLEGSLDVSLQRLRVPAFLRPSVREQVLRPGSLGKPSGRRGGTSLVEQVLQGAREAFVAGSHAALRLTAALLLTAALVCLAAAAATRRDRPASARSLAPPT